MPDDERLATGDQQRFGRVVGERPHAFAAAGGDFSLDGERVIYANGEQTLTYAGIGVFSPFFFAGVQPDTIMKLRPLLDAAIAAGTLTGERFTGHWVDVGTPQRLAELDQELRDTESRNA